MSDALGAIIRQPRASAANYLIAHRDGEAINVEVAPGDYSRVYTEFPGHDGTFTHTNHYTSAAFDLKDVSLWDGPDSPFRLHRMQQFLKRAHGKLTPDMLQEFFSDHFNLPHAICRHPDPRIEPAARYATVTSVLMDLNTGTMWVADGNPCETLYRALDYSSLLDKAPSFM
jgi:isopenicillin-N N-acyltransferase-like protein